MMSLKDLINNSDYELHNKYSWIDTEYHREVFNLWGDEDTEVIEYKLADEGGNTVDEGEHQICEDAVCGDQDAIIGENYHPEYLLIRRDRLKRAYAVFEVDEDFSMEDCEWEDSNPMDRRMRIAFPTDLFGDTIASVNGPIKCHDKTYSAYESDNAGDTGETDFMLCEYNEDEREYKVLASVSF